MLRVLRTFLALVILVPSLALAADAPLKVIVFPGGFNWPIWVAQDKAFFKDNGVTIELTPTPSSAFQLVGLIDGPGGAVSIESPFTGFLMGILAVPGERVCEGEPVAWLRTTEVDGA